MPPAARTVPIRRAERSSVMAVVATAGTLPPAPQEHGDGVFWPVAAVAQRYSLARVSAPGPAPSDIEIEWQFDALDLRPVERWLADVPPLDDGPAGAAPTVSVEPGAPKRLVDSYMDTEDWRVARSGFVLRMRKRAGGCEATLKDTAPAKAGLRRRLEVTEPLGPEGLSSIGAEGPVGWRLRALAGTRPMAQILEVRTRRRPYVLRVGGQPVAEIALDDTVIDMPDGLRPVRLRRVEVEVQAAWVERTARLVARMRSECGLQPATLSKFEAGLLASGLRVPSLPDVGPTTLSDTPTIGELAFVVLRRNYELMLRHEPGTRLGEDAEDLHDMRVATRRMRAALAMFVDVLPVRGRHIRAELGWLADVLGAVRDLDVQLERVDSWMEEVPAADRGALGDLIHLLDEQRRRARGSLLDTLESSRYERLVSGFESMLRQGPLRRSAPARAHALMAAPDIVRLHHRKVGKAAKRARRSGAAEDFHRLRIRCKRLRYALEFVSELYPGHTSKYVRRVVAIQDTLGLMQDSAVASERLKALAEDETAELSRAAVFVMGGVAQRYNDESKRLARRVPDHLDDLSGSQWHRMIGHFDQRRLEIAPMYGWTAHLSGPSAAASPTPPAPSTHPSAGVAEVSTMTGERSALLPQPAPSISSVHPGNGHGVVSNDQRPGDGS